MKKNLIWILHFYYDGFRSMTVGKNLWIILILKMAIIFLVLKLFFFPDFLNEKFNSDKERSDYIIHELTNTNN